MKYLILLLMASTCSLAQPTTNYTFVVPWLAGGAVDYVARTLAKELETKNLKVQVENRPGLNGVLGANYVIKSKDRTIFLVDQLTTYLNQTLNRDSLTFDMTSDLRPLAHIAEQYSIISAHPSVPVDSFRTFLTHARRSPNLFSFGHGGKGSPSYITFLTLQKYGNLHLYDINYKSNIPALIALAGGEIDIIGTNATVAMPFVRMKKIKPIATSWINNNQPELVGVEPASKYIPELTETMNMVLFAPTSLPREVTVDIRSIVINVVNSPEFASKMSNAGNQAKSLSNDDLDLLLKKRLSVWNSLIN